MLQMCVVPELWQHQGRHSLVVGDRQLVSKGVDISMGDLKTEAMFPQRTHGRKGAESKVH